MQLSSSAHPRVRPLQDPVLVFVDDTAESSEAKQTLLDVGIDPLFTDDPVEPYQRKPLLLFRGAFIQGLPAIRAFVHLLEFWSSQPIQRSVFRYE
jgi:hypothetical protein